MTKKELWKTVLGDLELTVSHANFITWFRNTDLISKKQGRVIISVPNVFTKEWLENKYNKFILKALRDLNEEVKNIEYVVGKESEAASLPPRKTKNTFFETQKNQLLFDEFKVDKETGLNPRYTFNSFIVGSSNELAHAASWAICKKPGVIYNPLFIYGGVGLGKTHLLQASGNEIVKKSLKRTVKYIPSEKFTSELVSSIRDKTINSFKEKYRKIDVLIIDDVQFLAGKEKTQEEFFHIFNALYEKNKQIVLSSDRPPKAIPTLEERLRSRFEGGMIADIGPPDFETRVAILKTKSIEKGVNFQEEVYSYIAESVQKNIRELEGALNRLMVYTDLNGGVDLNKAKEVLQGIFKRNQKQINYKDILKIVAEFYNIDEKDILAQNRKKEVVLPRQIVMYLMREELKNSYPYIGSKLGGKDHTTVIHACEKIEKNKNIDENLNETISLIKERICTM